MRRFSVQIGWLAAVAWLFAVTTAAQDPANPIGEVTSTYDVASGIWQGTVMADPSVSSMSLIPIQGTLQPSAAVNAMPPTLPSQDPLLPAQWSFFALAANQYTGFVIQYSSTIDPTPIQVPAEGFYPMNPADPNQVVPSAEQPIESDVPAVPKEENFVDKDALKYAAIVVAAITVLFAGCLITISCRNASAASRAYPKREQSRSRPSNAGPPDVEEIVVMPRNSQDPVRQQP